MPFTCLLNTNPNYYDYGITHSLSSLTNNNRRRRSRSNHHSSSSGSGHRSTGHAEWCYQILSLQVYFHATIPAIYGGRKQIYMRPTQASTAQFRTHRAQQHTVQCSWVTKAAGVVVSGRIVSPGCLISEDNVNINRMVVDERRRRRTTSHSAYMDVARAC